MTRKDYEALAKTFLHLPAWIFASPEAYRRLVSEVADTLAEDSRHFDRVRFFRACGLPS
jgi:hypothetical protein